MQFKVLAEERIKLKYPIVFSSLTPLKRGHFLLEEKEEKKRRKSEAFGTVVTLLDSRHRF